MVQKKKKSDLKVKINGYDRNQVDDMILFYSDKITRLENQISQQQIQIDKQKTVILENNQYIQKIKEENQVLNVSLNKKVIKDHHATKKALDNAKEIVMVANTNADIIISEALNNAQSILLEVAHLSTLSKVSKRRLLNNLFDLTSKTIKIKNEKMPDLRWLKQQENSK